MAPSSRERLTLFEQFEPVEYLRGLDGNGHYIGAKYAEDFVVLENLKHGNARYVSYDDRDELAQKTCSELQELSSKKYDRINHSGNWQNIFAARITEELRQRGLRICVGRNRRRRKR